MSEAKVSLSELLANAIDSFLSDLHTCLPGRVESFDDSTRLAKVVPLLRRKYAAETVAVELPVISNVPVMDYRANDAWIKLPIKSGDYVLLVFAERSLDIWLEKGGSVDPMDPAKFALNDAVAYPGIYPKPSAMSPKGAATSLEIVNKNAVIELTASSEVKITATKILLTCSDIELGDATGSALLRTLDVSSIIAPAGTAGGPCTLLPGAGTLKVKGS